MKSTRILVTGANGQLGLEIKVISINYSEFDFSITSSTQKN